MSHFSAVEKSLQAATEATEKMRKLSAERGSSIAVAVHNLASLGVKPHKVSNNDRPKRLKEHLKNITTDDTAEE